MLNAPPLCHTHLEKSTLHQDVAAINCRHYFTMVSSNFFAVHRNCIHLFRHSFFVVFITAALLLRFKIQPLQGFIIQLFFIALGAWLTWQKDMRHHKNWYGNYYKEGSYLVVRIDEPLVEKNKSFKADGYVEAVVQDGKTIAAEGKLLLYFSKDSIKTNLAYGDRIIIRKNLQTIKNTGNPGAFNYQRYAAFPGYISQCISYKTRIGGF